MNVATKPSTARSAPIAMWREHPSQMVRDLFNVNPDPWQEEALEAFPRNPMLAMKACKGPGKTGTLAWLAWNFLLTRPYPKCAATSISADNLRDNLWAEMAKWRDKSDLLKSKFEWTTTRIFMREAPETWFLSARTWPKTANPEAQSDTLAGLHADYILFLIDESGGIPQAVMATAEAALSSCIEGHIVQAGNPTHLEGPLYAACTSQRKFWYVIEITGDPDDPRRSTRISVDWARQQIEKYGRNNPWVMVNVLGKFPPGSINTLIGPDEVDAAMDRYYREYQFGHEAKILGVDVARFGDDSSVIAKRQGIQAFPMLQIRNANSIDGAARVATEWQQWGADACFVDNTGGFGSGWIDQLGKLGRSPIPVEYASKAIEAGKYFNKRAEMYFKAIEWITNGGALPKIPELKAALITTTYTFRDKRLLLEPKEQVKDRLGYSPDHADAFVQTFHSPVTPLPRGMGNVVGARHQFDHNPFASMQSSDRAPTHQVDYNPYKGM